MNYYGRLVDKINRSIGQDPTAKSIIGVLDIYGFESFKVNRYVVVDFMNNYQYIKTFTSQQEDLIMCFIW